MKTTFQMGLGAFMVFVLVCFFASQCIAEECVVTEIQGTLLTLGCPGGVSTTENLGGTVDTYQVGQRIDLNNAQGRTRDTDPRDAIKQGTNPTIGIGRGR